MNRLKFEESYPVSNLGNENNNKKQHFGKKKAPK